MVFRPILPRRQITGQVLPSAVETTDLPNASESRYSILTDKDLNTPVYSDGERWLPLSLTGSTQITVTVGSGGDFATLNEAINFGLRFQVSRDENTSFTVDIIILSGHVVSEKVWLERRDARHIQIKSVDAEVLVDGTNFDYGFGNPPRYDYFMNVVNANGPLIRTRFRPTNVPVDKGLRGLRVRRGGFAEVVTPTLQDHSTTYEPSGFVGFEIGAFVFSNSSLFASGASFSDSSDIGILCTRNSVVDIDRATITGCGLRSIEVGSGSRMYVEANRFSPDDTSDTYNGYTIGDFRKVPGVDSPDDVTVIEGGEIVRNINDNFLGGTNVPFNTRRSEGLIRERDPSRVDFSGGLIPWSYTAGALPNAVDNEGMILKDETIGLPVVATGGEWSTIPGRLYSIRTLYVGPDTDDYPTLSDAIAQAMNFRRGYPETTNPFVKIIIRSGYTISEGRIFLSNNNFGMIEIDAEDPIVDVDAVALSQEVIDRDPDLGITSLFKFTAVQAPFFKNFKFRLVGTPLNGIRCDCWSLDGDSTLLVFGQTLETSNGVPAGCEGFGVGVDVRTSTLIAGRSEFNNGERGVLVRQGAHAFLDLVNAYGNSDNGLLADLNSTVVVSGRDVAADLPDYVVPYFGNFRNNATTATNGTDSPADIEARSGAKVHLYEVGGIRSPVLGGVTPPRGTQGGGQGGGVVVSNLGDEIVTWTGPVQPKSYIATALPNAVDNEGMILWDSTNQRLVVSDGTNWRSVDTTAI